MDGEVLMEVPQKLQMLVRLVVRGFYSTEDILIVDMLVRNFCKFGVLACGVNVLE